MKTESAAPTEIVDIRVVNGAEKTEVVVAGQQAMIYTTFHLTDPNRLIVDLAGVSLGKFKEKIPVAEGPVHSILPVAGEENQVGRLEIEVDPSAETNVRTEGTNLIIDVSRAGLKTADTAAAKPAENATPEENKAVIQAPIREEQNLQPAKVVKSIRFDRKEDLQLVIASDGQLSPNVFLLDPKRLVIDLPNVKLASKMKAVPVKDQIVKQARIGLHSDKVRLVLDLAAPVIYTLHQEGNQFYVHIKAASSKPKKEKQETAPSSEVAAAVVSPPSPAPLAGMTLPKVEPPPVTLASADAKAEPVASPGSKAELKAETPAPAPSKPASKEEAPKTEVPAPPVAETAETAPESAEAPEEQGKSSDESEKKGKVDAVTSPKYVGRRVSLDFQDADIANVIRLISDVSNLNVVLGEDIKGKVTLKLINVPWDQALDMILKMNNLGQIREGNIIRIATLTNIARQQDEEAKAKETKVRAEDLQTRIIYVNYGKARDLVESMKKVLSTRGDLTIDDRTNALIVKDIEKNIDEIGRLVKKIDKETPQVVIEARIVQVAPTFNRSLGIQWGATLRDVRSPNVIGLSGGGGTPNAVFGTPDPSFAVNLPSAPNFGGLGFTFGRFTDNPFNLDLRLSAGESQGLTRVISTPKVSVLNNQEAKIEQGESIPFATTSQQGTQTTFVDANLTLLVTPHISPDGGIIMKVKVTKNAPAETRPGASGPSILRKEATTNVLVRDGETTVIGGIYETTKSDSISGIPYLMDIPVLGWLFKTTTKREDVSELLVFLTPRIMK
ncbi:MAG: type IV pilus secretin PilQ [Nitrospirae bacterium]|nr:type IV pilus secretin PilQ [Candidatus Manganitrophaceae bacterium]